MNKILATFLSVIILSMLTSCNDFDDLSKNPNKTAEVTPSLLFTGLTLSFKGGNRVPYSELLCKQIVWYEAIEDYQYYKFGRSSFDPYHVIRNAQKMMEEAKKTDEDVFFGLAHLFRAWKFYDLTMTFGQVPYKDAVKGESENLYQPKYDTQEEIFTGILEELETANEILAQTECILTGDIVFGNNIMKWRRVVNTFRLRVLMSLSKKVGETKINVAEQFKMIVNDPSKYPLIESNDDNWKITYSDKEGERYPSYNDVFSMYPHFDEFFMEILKEKQDRRLFCYAQMTGVAKDAGLEINDYNAYAGVDGTKDLITIKNEVSAKKVSLYHQRYYEDPINEPAVVIGFAEKEFLLAEAAHRNWITKSAAEHYNNGITASMHFYKKYGQADESCQINDEYIENYLNSEEVKYDSSKGLKQIIIQKYLNSFYQNQYVAYFDYRRTGYPEFPINPETSLNAGYENQIPLRWMYPINESNNNKENVEEAIKNQYGEDHVNAKMWLIKD